jgi:hypothetical protein
MNESDNIDIEDFRILMQAVIRAAVTDYITLQHPSKRRKSDVKKALASSWDMLFDNTYESMKIHTPEGTPMCLRDILEGAMPNTVVDIEDMRKRIINEAATFWSETEIKTINFPEFVSIYGHVYNVYHKDQASTIDFDNKTIWQDLTKGKVSELQFVKLCMKVAAHHSAVPVNPEVLEALSDGWFEILRMNNCFVGID